MFKSKRRLELEKAEAELHLLKNEIREMMYWCAADSPEIGFAMQRLLSTRESISSWRERLRTGEFKHFDNYIAYLLMDEHDK